MITRRLFMALAGAATTMAASPALAVRLGHATPTLGELWGQGFLAAGGSRIAHAPRYPALFPDGAWHPDFV